MISLCARTHDRSAETHGKEKITSKYKTLETKYINYRHSYCIQNNR